MPYDDPDPTDPHELVGIVLPSGPDATREMAYAFAEEFARDGMERERILSLFRNPYYGGAHGVYRQLGADAVARIVDECLAAWGRARWIDRDAEAAARPSPNDAEGRDDADRS
jgi:hypothetical protein